MNYYYLVITNNHGDFEIIKGFSKVPGFETIQENTIQGITNFTNEFLDKEALTTFLRENNLFPTSPELTQRFKEFDYRILMQKKNNNFKLLDFGISYSPTSYFYNINKLLQFYQNHLYDRNFMALFNRYFYETLGQISKFRPSLTYLKNTSFSYDSPKEIIQLGKEKLRVFILDYLDLNNKNKMNYLRLREIAMFAITYQENYEFEPEVVDEFAKAEINHYEELLSGDLTEEERESYLARIDELKGKRKLG